MAISFKQVTNAFQTLEIADPERFSGRVAQVERGSELLLSGTSIFIHGIRGIGKSSLALQLERIASGDKRLLERIRSPFADESYDYATCVVKRDDSINNINALLFRVLIDQAALAQWTDLLPELGAPPIFELSGPLNPLLVAEFWNRVAAVSALTKDGVAIFVDEFERIRDRMGFSSIIKALPRRCLFVVTGIAETEKELVGDHESIQRQLGAGKLLVPKMQNDELRLIIENAEEAVLSEIRFEEPATARLIEIAKGHPYLIHLVGRTAMVAAFRNKASTITKANIEDALAEIASGRVDTFLQERYLTAIGNSSQRETVLRVFAEEDSPTVSTTVAYPKAKREGVGNPSYYVGDLQKQQFGAELIKVAENHYAISDSLFKAYVAATPPRLSSGSSRDDDAPTAEHTGAAEFTLVHLSDIHFGAEHYFTTLGLAADNIPEADRPSLLKYLSNALSTTGEPPPPELLVISGDLTQTGVTAEFEQARSFLRQLLPRLAAPEDGYASRVVLVPGNHDINWGAFNADPGNRSLPYSGFISFVNEFGATYAHTIEPERIYRVHDYVSALGAVVVAFNSAVLEGPSDHRGYIGETQLSNALHELTNVPGSDRAVRVAVFHHHICSVPTIEESLRRPDEVLRDVALVKQRLLDERFHLVLHGHRHHSHVEVMGNEHHRMVVCGCGSSGVSQKERGQQPLQFNWITVRSQANSVTVAVRPFHFDVIRRTWSPASHKPQVYNVTP